MIKDGYIHRSEQSRTVVWATFQKSANTSSKCYDKLLLPRMSWQNSMRPHQFLLHHIRALQSVVPGCRYWWRLSKLESSVRFSRKTQQPRKRTKALGYTAVTDGQLQDLEIMKWELFLVQNGGQRSPEATGFLNHIKGDFNISLGEGSSVSTTVCVMHTASMSKNFSLLGDLGSFIFAQA